MSSWLKKLTHVFNFLQVIIVIFQRWKIIFSFIESINQYNMTPKSESLSLEYDTYFFSTKHSNITDFKSIEKTKILNMLYLLSYEL